MAMWKRDETAQTEDPQITSAADPPSREGSGGAKDNVIIGKSIVVKGELHGAEHLTIEGQVEGKITLKQHVLTIGPHGRIRAQVLAKSIVVRGEVVGNIEATEKVAIHDDGTVEGDIKAPRVAIAEGAKFRGGIDMQQEQRPGQPAGQPPNRPRSDMKPGGEPRRPVPGAKVKSA